jgi:hypothetical protein
MSNSRDQERPWNIRFVGLKYSVIHGGAPLFH